MADREIDSILDSVAESFVDRYRRGERPSVESFVERYPEFADEIRRLIRTLVSLEQVEFQNSLPATDRTAPPPMEKLGDFQIIREVGRGGMGVVYEAEQLTLGRRVALKTLPNSTLVTEKQIERFQAEAKAVASLQHPNIVPIFAVGSDEGIHFYAMQFIHGQGLDDILKEIRQMRDSVEPFGETDRQSIAASLSSPQSLASNNSDATQVDTVDSTSNLLSEGSSYGGNRQYYRSVAKIGLQASLALDYAHNNGVLHRDIKPSNLMLDMKNNLWVTDFGLAKSMGSESLTNTGDLVGTLRYMAPERFSGVSDLSGDVYSLGITLYEMLTLQPAFPSSDRTQLMKDIVDIDPPSLRRFDPTVPKDLETIIHKAIAKEPQHRYPKALDLANELQCFLDGRPIAARPTSLNERFWRWCRREPRLAAAAAIAFALTFMLFVGGMVMSAQLSSKNERLQYEKGVSDERRQRAEDAETLSRQQLFESYLQSAKASSQSGRPGQRIDTLKAVKQAAALIPEVTSTPEQIVDLRSYAASAMALPDLRNIRFDANKAGISGPDLQRLARFDTKGRVSIIEDDVEIAHLDPGSDSEVRHIGFDPTGQYLAVFDAKFRCRVWNLETKKTVIEVNAQRSFRRPFDFAMSVSTVAIIEKGNKVVVYDLASGKALFDFKPEYELGCVAISPDGKQIGVSRLDDYDIEIWQLDSMERRVKIECRKSPAVLAFDADGTQIAAGCHDFNTYIWDTRDGEHRSTLRGHQSAVTEIQFSSRNNLLATTSWDGTTRLWNPSSGQQQLLIDRYLDRISAKGNLLSFRQHIVQDGAIGVGRGDLEIGNELLTLGTYALGHIANYTRCATVHSSNRWAVTGGSHGLRTWELKTGRRLKNFPLMDVNWLTFNKEEDQLLVAGRVGVYRIKLSYDEFGPILGEPEAIVKPRSMNTTDGYQGDLSRDGNYLAAVVSRSWIGVIDLTTGDVKYVRAAAGIGPLAISSTGKWLAMGTMGGLGLPLWNVEEDVKEMDLWPGARSVYPCFSPSDHYLVAGNSTEFRVWETKTWKKVKTIKRDGSRMFIRQPRFSDDGRFLAIPTTGHAVQLISTANWQPLLTLESPLTNTILRHIRLSPDSSRLITANGFCVQVWNLTEMQKWFQAVGLNW